MTKKTFFYKIYFLFFLITGCGNNKAVSRLTSFDVSSDGNFIVYSFINDENQSELYTAKLDGTDTKLFVSMKDYSFFNPKFSNDGTKVVFVGNNKMSRESSIWEINVDGRSLRKILADKGFISEVIYSEYNENLFYIRANEYDSYSPIVSKARHDFDIYSLVVDSLKGEKISELKAYNLYGLVELNKSKLLIGQRGSDFENGIFFFDKNSNTKLEKIETTNDKLKNSTGYSNPIVVADRNIVCSSYYQLVRIDLATKLEEIILPSTGYHFRKICYNKRLERIFFTKKDDTDNIYSIDKDGENFQEVTLLNNNVSD